MLINKQNYIINISYYFIFINIILIMYITINILIMQSFIKSIINGSINLNF